MAENVHSDIIINVDTSVGIAQIKNLQKQVSALNAQLLKSGAAQARAAENVQRNLLNNINATGQFAANVRNISSTTETFTNRLEKNKFGLGEYFRYAGGASKTFGRLFRNEFDTIEKVARERVKTLQTQYTKLSRGANGSLQAIAVRPLALDMSNLGTQTAIAAQKQQIFNQLIRQGSTNLLNFGKNTQWAGRQLMVGFSIPLAYLGTMAAKTFMQMEEQAIRFKRVYGDSFTASSETDKMVSQIKDLASEFTKYGVAVEKTMKMAADAAAMGKMGADLLAQVGEATRLAVLGGVEQDQALQTTISLTNAFGLAAEKLAGKIDFLNAVENQTVTSIEDLTIAVPKAGPVIQQLGGDVEDLAFFLTAMREGGINASEGANALKSGLASLINPSGKAAEMLKSFGINIKGIVEANKGDVKGIVIEFAKALDTLDPLNRSRAIEQLFGKFQFARLSTLFQNVIQQGTQAERVLKLSSSTIEELAVLSERELKRIEDSPMYKFKKSVEDIKVSLVPLGEAFLKAVTPIIEFVKGFLDKFNEMSDGAKQFTVLITTVVAGIGPILLMTFGLIANGAANIIKLFAAMKNAFSGVGGQSNLLGSQTEYLTQQQLEASAVAASLDQKHSKLIQTFTSETGAVNSLATAYARAVVAQSKLLGVPVAAGGKALPGVKKYRSGVVSVPGPKGAGDVVPAMLSPGEAVIPAKMANRYSGLISSMIDGKIPGYEYGTDNVGDGKRRNLIFPHNFGLQASHMSQGTGVLDPNTAKNIMNRELDKLISQGVIKESMVDRSLISKISQNVKLNSQTVGMLTGTFNQWFTTDKAVKDLSSIVRELSRTKGMVGGSLIPNLDYLSSNGMAGKVSESTTKKYLSDLDKTFRSMIANSKTKELSEKQLQDIFKKAQDAAERKIVKFDEKDSIRKANLFGRSTLSPAAPGKGGPGRTNLQTPLIGYSDAQKLTRQPGNRDRIAKLSGVIDRWMPQNSKYIMSSESQTARIKNLLKALPPAEAKQLVSAITASDGSSKALDEIVKKVINKEKITVPAAKKALPKKPMNALPRSGNQTFNLSEILGPTAKSVPSGKAGLIAKLFGRKYAFGTGAVKPLNRASMLAGFASKIKSQGSNAGENLLRLITGNKVTKFGAEQDFWTKSIANKFAKRRNPKIAVRMKEEDLLSLINSKDKRYKSVFETNKSYAGDTPADRAIAEQALFGLSPNVNPALRPTYGYMFRNERNITGRGGTDLFKKLTGKRGVSLNRGARKRLFESQTASLMNPKTFMYGNTAMVLKTRNIKNRTTFTYGDSYNRVLDKFATPAKLGTRSNKDINAAYTSKDKDFFEAQIMGGFTLKDVKKIVVTEPQLIPNLQAALRAQGLNIRVGMPKFTMLQKLRMLFSRKDARGKMAYGQQLPFTNEKGAYGVPRGYASGVVSVPGPKGKGDVVPAMLSPGEAVIPTKMANKYRPLINSMISDSVPGYAKGKKSFNFGDKYKGTQGLPVQTNAMTPMAAGKELASSFASKMKAVGATLGNMAGLSLIKAQNAASRKMDAVQEKRAEKAAIRTERAAAKLAATASPNEKEPKPPGAVAGKLAAFGGVASMGAMMYGMSGGPGADVANQVAMPLMMLSMVLPMIASKTGMVVAGLLAVAGAITYIAIQASEATKAGIKAAKSMSMTNKKVEEFAAINGVVSSTQEAQKKRENQLTGESGKKRYYGQTFLESDAGKSLLLDAESMSKSGQTNQEIAENFSNQLSYAVLQGSVTQEQAASIAAALGEKLQDYSISAKIVGNLTALYGRNGENLLTDPLSISLGIQKQATAQQNMSYENYKSTIGEVAGSAPTDLLSASLGMLNPVQAVKGYVAMYDSMLKIKESSGLVTQLGIEQVAQNQGLLDSINDRYDTQIQELRSKKEIAKTDEERAEIEGQITDKVRERNTAISKQKTENKKVFDGLLDQAEAMGPAFGDSMGAAIEDRFKDATGSLKISAQMAKDALAALPSETDGEFNTFKATLQFGLAADQFDPMVALNLANAAMSDKTIETNFNLIAAAQGTSDANQLLQLMNKSGLKTENYSVILEYFNKNSATFKEDTEALAQIANMEQEYGITIDLNVKGDEKIAGVSNFLQETSDLKGKPVTRKRLEDQIAKGKKEGMDPEVLKDLQDMLTNFEILSGGDGSFDYQISVDYVIGKANDAAIWAWAISKNPALASQTVRVTTEMRAEFVGEGGNGPEGDKKKGEDDTTTDGGAARQDILDDLLKRLQNVRKASVDAKGGMTELMSLLKTGKNFTGFSGIEQQLSLKGYSEEFIRFMADADKADQKRFMSNNKGIVKLKEEGKALQNLFSAVTLGNFERSIRESIGGITRELDARKTIIELTGMSYNDAAEAARDAGLAETIAAIKASTAIRNKNKAIKEAINLYKEEKAALESAKTMQEQFDDAYNAQMDVISAKQATINVAFDIETDSFNDAMASAQADIDKKINQPGGLDDLQAGLQSITWQEDAINKTYDERLEALDKIEKANEKIAAQQKAQLGIADALSRGDISAAAQAAQELRSSNVKESFQTQRELIEQSRNAELGGLTATVNGSKKTRKEIEAEILKIEKEIFAIEESRLEPARESIRLATVLKDIKLDALDDEKLKWDELKAKIDLATASASSYLKTLAEASALSSGAGKATKPAESSYVSPFEPGTTKWYTGKNPPVTPQQYEKNGYVFAKDANGNYLGDDETGGLIILDSPFERALNNAKAKSVGGMAMGGLVPKYFVNGGFAKGTDTVPAMLTPGEFVVKKYAVDSFGVDNLKAINSGAYKGNSVYNYEVSVNVKSESNPDQIARAVMTQIKQIDEKRIRGNRLNG